MEKERDSRIHATISSSVCHGTSLGIGAKSLDVRSNFNSPPKPASPTNTPNSRAMEYPEDPAIALALTRLQNAEIRDALQYAYHHFPLFRNTVNEAGVRAPDQLPAWFTHTGNVILAGIRSLKTRQRLTTSGQSLPRGPTYGSPTPGGNVASDPTPGSDPPPSNASAMACLERDQYQCIITGRDNRQGFAIRVSHIIPHSLSYTGGCRDEAFWKTLELLYGTDITSAMWEIAGGANVNNIVNLYCVDISLHPMLETNAIYLLAYKPSDPPVLFTPDDFIREPVVYPYHLQLISRMTLTVGVITTGKDRTSAVALPVRSGDFLTLELSEHPLPHPLLINCRAGLLGLLHHCRPLPEPEDYVYPEEGHRDESFDFVNVYHPVPVQEEDNSADGVMWDSPEDYDGTYIDPEELAERLEMEVMAMEFSSR